MLELVFGVVFVIAAPSVEKGALFRSGTNATTIGGIRTGTAERGGDVLRKEEHAIFRERLVDTFTT